MSNQTILERFKNRCPVCNHNEVHKDDEPTWDYLGVTCNYCGEKWDSIYDYETDCEFKEDEWKLEDRIDVLEDKIKRIRNQIMLFPQADGIYDDNGDSEGMPICKGLKYDFNKISDFLAKMKTILDS